MPIFSNAFMFQRNPEKLSASRLLTKWNTKGINIWLASCRLTRARSPIQKRVLPCLVNVVSHSPQQQVRMFYTEGRPSLLYYGLGC